MAKLRVNVIAGVGTTSAGPVFQGEVEFDSQNFLTIPKERQRIEIKLVVVH